VDQRTSEASRISLIAAFAAVYILWGSTYFAIRVGIETIPPFPLAGSRHLAAGIPMLAWMLLRGAPAPTWREWRSAAIVGTLLLAGGNGLVTIAERSVPSSLAAVLIATVPLWMTGLDAALFRGPRLTPATIVGLAAGLSGVGLLVWRSGDGADALEPWGAAALLIAALSWSFGSLWSRRLTLPASPFVAVSAEMIAGGAVLLAIAGLTGQWGEFIPAQVSTRSWTALVYLTIAGSILGFTAYIWLLRHVTPVAASTYAFVNPVVAVFLGAAFAGERLTVRSAIASALVIGAVVVLHGSRWLASRRLASRGG
jgi:drug/metabolite transporter (DMT)-like permease